METTTSPMALCQPAMLNSISRILFPVSYFESATQTLLYDNAKNEAPSTFKSHIHIVSHPLAHLGLLDLCLLSSSASGTDVLSSMTEGTSFPCRAPVPSRHCEDNTNCSSSWKVSHHAMRTSLLFLSYTLHICLLSQWVILGASNSNT